MPASDNSPLPVLGIVDPRQARLLGVDSQLPAVPLDAQTPQALRTRYPAATMAARAMQEKRITARQPSDAAVLVPIVMREQPTVLLTVRSARLSTHSGQVAFPGGKRDPQDVSAEATALREAHEEVGLAPRNVEVLGRLPLYVTGTAFHITPVVALVHPQASYFPNPGRWRICSRSRCPICSIPRIMSVMPCSGRAWIANGLPCPIRMVSSSAISGVRQRACCAIFTVLAA